MLIREYLICFIDFFHPPFAKLIPLKTFRYAATGGSNALLNFLMFYLSYTFLFKGRSHYVADFTVAPHIAANITALCISFPVGFLMNKYIVFQESERRGRHQILLYGVLTVMTICMSIGLLDFFVNYLGFWATPSQGFIIILMSAFSYFFQSHVTFR